jgi:hypothetical protein
MVEARVGIGGANGRSSAGDISRLLDEAMKHHDTALP